MGSPLAKTLQWWEGELEDWSQNVLALDPSRQSYKLAMVWWCWGSGRKSALAQKMSQSNMPKKGCITNYRQSGERYQNLLLRSRDASAHIWPKLARHSLQTCICIRIADKSQPKLFSNCRERRVDDKLADIMELEKFLSKLSTWKENSILAHPGPEKGSGGAFSNKSDGLGEPAMQSKRWRCLSVIDI